MEAKEKQVGGDHYTKHDIQPWDIVDEYKLSFYAGSALKYLLRNKGDLRKKIEDIDKAIHCLEKEKERLDSTLDVREGKTPTLEVREGAIYGDISKGFTIPVEDFYNRNNFVDKRDEEILQFNNMKPAVMPLHE